MFTLLRSLPFRELLLAEAPGLAASFVIAELFYKFHSFTLECGAFLLTWSAISAAAHLLIPKRILRPHAVEERR